MVINEWTASNLFKYFLVFLKLIEQVKHEIKSFRLPLYINNNIIKVYLILIKKLEQIRYIYFPSHTKISKQTTVYALKFVNI